MKIFKLRKHGRDNNGSSVEARFQKMVDLVRDLSRADFNKQMDALKLIYDGYAKVSSVKTNEEKESQIVDTVEQGFMEVPNA